jgi:hypothetical protein
MTGNDPLKPAFSVTRYAIVCRSALYDPFVRRAGIEKTYAQFMFPAFHDQRFQGRDPTAAKLLVAKFLGGIAGGIGEPEDSHEW